MFQFISYLNFTLQDAQVEVPQNFVFIPNLNCLSLILFLSHSTAFWSDLVEFCVDFVWKDIPEMLYELGLFTDLDGPRPLPHYMWVCPAFFGGVSVFEMNRCELKY